MGALQAGSQQSLTRGQHSVDPWPCTTQPPHFMNGETEDADRKSCSGQVSGDLTSRPGILVPRLRILQGFLMGRIYPHRDVAWLVLLMAFIHSLSHSFLQQVLVELTTGQVPFWMWDRAGHRSRHPSPRGVAYFWGRGVRYKLSTH